MKVVWMAVISIALIGIVAVGTVFLMGGSEQSTGKDDASESPAAAEVKTEVAKDHRADSSTHKTPVDLSGLPEGLLDGEDASVLESIVENLAMLDYQPNDSELTDEDIEQSRKDSVEKATWFEKEQVRLSGWEKELKERQKKLEKLDREISKKIVVIEQAESSRVASLAKLYDGMDSRSVAKLMANLDDETVVSILPRMKMKGASEVLALLPAKRAAKLSKQMITIAEK